MLLYNSSTFVERVSYALGKPGRVTWIVGSPLAYEFSSGLGVPGVVGVVELIRQQFLHESENLRLLDKALESSQNSYQQAFAFLAGYKGQREANHVVRRAVLKAYGPTTTDVSDDGNLARLEQDLERWNLPSGIEALGELVSSRSGMSASHVLTTNFDPLVEIALRRQGMVPVTSSFHRDGNPSSVHTEQPHVVHLHGYWVGSDTLHVPHQLLQERPQLRAALSAYLRSSTVIVIGYGGWDDVVTSALADVLKEDISFPEVIWAFNEVDEVKIQAKYAHVIARLEPGFARNSVSCYHGVDCHVALPAIASRRRGRLPPRTHHNVKEDSVPPPRLRTSDAVPTTDLFVGRIAELRALHQATGNVISISGLGGQGKSLLAAKFMEEYVAQDAKSPARVDWRDCKEEGNTAHLSLCLFLEAASDGAVSAGAIARVSGAELAGIFGDVVRHLRGVLVLDNIDTYVDVENSAPTGTIKAVVDRHLASNSEFKIVLTSRPELRIPSAAFFGLHLDGLNREAVEELYNSRASSSLTEGELSRLIALTDGHALGVALLAAQKLSGSKSLSEILDELASSTSDLGRQILRGTYRLLRAEDQEVLRSLAELEKPEAETELEEITDLRFNRLAKATRRLRAMNLVIDRVDKNGRRLLDLHPLVRQFIRHEYPRKDRETFIGRILNFFERKLTPLRNQVGTTGVSPAILNMWLHKVEVLINQESWSQAVAELNLLAEQLERQGLNEEQIRLGEKVLVGADWRVLLEQCKSFRKWVSNLMGGMSYFGYHDRVTYWTGIYQSHTTRGGADSVVIDSIVAFDAWFRKDFDRAIALSAEARDRRQKVDVELDNDPAHTYALALRDSGQTAEALHEFLEGFTLDEALSGEESKGGTYYGNIGRCLQMGGDFRNALKAYRRCYEDFHKTPPTAMNAAWLRQWVGECLSELGEVETAFACFVSAQALWKHTSPILERQAVDRMHALLSGELSLDIEEMRAWKAERLFAKWGSGAEARAFAA